LKISNEAIWEFKWLYEKEFKESATFDEAKEMAKRLLRFYMIINKERQRRKVQRKYGKSSNQFSV
jgi:hypothetical protein